MSRTANETRMQMRSSADRHGHTVAPQPLATGQRRAESPKIRGADAAGPRLSPREHEIAELLTRHGLTQKASAEALGISPATVNTYLGRLYRKLGIHSRGELFAWAWEKAHQPAATTAPSATGTRPSDASSELGD